MHSSSRKILAGFAIALCSVLLLSGPFDRRPSKARENFVEVPFEFIRNQIVVQVKIAGKGPFNMLLDTDTDPSAIDLATAHELGLQLGSKGYQGSGGGTETNLVYPTKLPAVEIENITAKQVSAAGIDLIKLSIKLG